MRVSRKTIEAVRVALPVIAIAAMAVLVGTRVSMLHLRCVDSKPTPRYKFHRVTRGQRGTIYAAGGEVMAKTATTWDYYVDPVAASEDTRGRGRKISPAQRMEKIRRVSDALGLPLVAVMDAFARTNNRHVYLGTSSDSDAHDSLFPTGKERKNRIHGLIAEEKQVRIYPQGRRMSHVLGFLSKDPEKPLGGAGLELKYEKYLKGVPGEISGIRDAYGNEEPGHRSINAVAKPGYDIHLTIDHNIQYEVERILAEGLKTYRAEKAWAIVLNVTNSAVLAMASLPDFDPANFNSPEFKGEPMRNCAISENYEPGSVMKTLTACAVLNERRATPTTLLSSDRNDSRYYRLPSDSHRMDPYMTLTEALVHSSNVIFGKLGADMGPERLHGYMTRFGLGRRTGIDLPGEETGILPNPAKWDKVKWSRAPIGQGVSVTAIQMANAYACVGNDGELLRPYVVERIEKTVEDADGVASGKEVIYRHVKEVLGRPVTPVYARQVRAMMVGVAKKGGTARRAAIPGYTIAGKTGTGQMKEGKGYSQTNFNSSFIGIVPAATPRIVILVTYQKPAFCRSYKLSQETGIPLYNHQGGLCAAPTFRQIATSTLRYLGVEPDVPEEMPEEIE